MNTSNESKCLTKLKDMVHRAAEDAAKDRHPTEMAAFEQKFQEFQDITESSLDNVPLKNFPDYFPACIGAYGIPDHNGDLANSVVEQVMRQKKFKHQSGWTEVGSAIPNQDGQQGKGSFTNYVTQTWRYHSLFLVRCDDSVSVLHVQYKIRYTLQPTRFLARNVLKQGKQTVPSARVTAQPMQHSDVTGGQHYVNPQLNDHGRRKRAKLNWEWEQGHLTEKGYRYRENRIIMQESQEVGTTTPGSSMRTRRQRYDPYDISSSSEPGHVSSNYISSTSSAVSTDPSVFIDWKPMEKEFLAKALQNVIGKQPEFGL